MTKSITSEQCPYCKGYTERKKGKIGEYLKCLCCGMNIGIKYQTKMSDVKYRIIPLS